MEFLEYCSDFSYFLVIQSCLIEIYLFQIFLVISDNELLTAHQENGSLITIVRIRGIQRRKKKRILKKRQRRKVKMMTK